MESKSKLFYEAQFGLRVLDSIKKGMLQSLLNLLSGVETTSSGDPSFKDLGLDYISECDVFEEVESYITDVSDSKKNIDVEILATSAKLSKLLEMKEDILKEQYLLNTNSND